MLGQYARLAGSHTWARLGQLLGTVGAAAYSLYVLLLLLLLAAPVLRVGLWLTPAGPPTASLLRRLSRALFRAAGWRVRVEGLEHLQGAGPWVLTANHVSYLDPLALLVGLPVDFLAVAKQEARSWPLVGTAVLRAGHLTVDRVDTRRGVEGAARATELLRQGTSVLFFPEGTRAPSTALLPFRLGAFKAAVEVGRPVVPIHIEGTHHILPRGWHLIRPGHITLSIREPLLPQAEGWPEMARLRAADRAGLASTSLGTGGAPLRAR
jgi:1-acyl-sn-glycerol-3-phosphate acyltransferase